MTEVLAERYELGRLLGTGGMARVVEAHDRLLARRVAVKLLHDDVLANTQSRERFLQEARTAASLSHPNAVAVYDTGRDGKRPYIVMELVEGRTLAEELARVGRLNERTAVGIIAQILDALAAGHRRGLVHRDVKPSNIMLVDPDADGRAGTDHGVPYVKLTDFGIAKYPSADPGMTATGQVMGTPKYLAPEQVDGHPATPRSDVYAVGLVLYEMLAGVPPFEGDSPIALALAHRDQAPAPLAKHRRGLTPAVVAVVERALDKNPEHRYADADQMRAALVAHAVAGPTRLPIPPPRPADTPAPDRTPAGTRMADPAVLDRPRPARRGPAWAVLAVAMLFALLGLLAFSAARNLDAQLPGTPAVGSAEDGSGGGAGAADEGGSTRPDADSAPEDEDVSPRDDTDPDAPSSEEPPDEGGLPEQNPGDTPTQAPGDAPGDGGGSAPDTPTEPAADPEPPAQDPAPEPAADLPGGAARGDGGAQDGSSTAS
jgi:serine/threonine-protein kinase